MRHTEKEFLMMLEALAELTSFKLTPFLAKFYMGQLKDYGWERVNEALMKLMTHTRRWPTVAEIEEAMGIVTQKAITAEDQARDAVSRIWEGIGKFGWCKPNEARAYIGELGWTVVERFGGWSAVTDLEEDQRMGITAQMRDLAISIQKFAAHGLIAGPALAANNPMRQALQIIEGGKLSD